MRTILVLLVKNKEQLKKQSKKLIEAIIHIGLEVNTNKTEYIVIQRKVPLNN